MAEPKNLHADEVSDGKTVYSWKKSGDSGAKAESTYYQWDLLTSVLDLHLFDNQNGGRSDLRGRQFFVEMSADGMTVRVVEE